MRADSPYKSVKEVLDAIKANPGKLKASGTGQGGIWHLALAGLLDDLKIPQTAIPWVPSNGAAPAMQDLVAGGVDIVTCSLPEARPLIEAGKAKPLAIMDDKRAALFPDVPTMQQAIGVNYSVAAWRGIAGPKGLPADVDGQAHRDDQEDRREQGVEGLRREQGLRHRVGAGPRVRRVHGEGRRGDGQDDEGGRPRQVTSDVARRSACASRGGAGSATSHAPGSRRRERRSASR